MVRPTLFSLETQSPKGHLNICMMFIQSKSSVKILKFVVVTKTKTLVRKLERILIKLYRQNVSLLFNQTCLNEGLLPNYTHTHILHYYTLTIDV